MSHATRPIRRSLRTITTSADLAALLVATVLIDAGVSSLPSTPTRALVALPLPLFFAGYAVVSAGFPSRFRRVGDDPVGIDLTERLALSFGTSLCLAPLVGLALASLPVGITVRSIVFAYTAVVVLGALVAASRRAALPDDVRFQFAVGRLFTAARANVAEVPRRDAVANIAVAVAVIAAAATVGVGLVAPMEGDGYETLSVLTENDEGALVAADYPSRLSVDASTELVATVENHRDRAVEYTLVVQFQRVAPDGTVTERTELDRFGSTVGGGETWERGHEVSPAFPGDRVRLTYLLYQSTPPETPTRDTADREVHLWMTVSG